MTTPSQNHQGQAATAEKKEAMPPQPFSAQVNVAALECKVDTLVSQARETNEALKQLTTAVSRLAVIEERQTNDRQAMDRAFTAISRLEQRVCDREEAINTRFIKLEERGPLNALVSSGVVKVVGLIIAAVVGAGLSGMLRAPQSQAPTHNAQPQK